MMRMEIGVKGKKIIGCAAGQQEIKKNLDHIAAALQESRNKLLLIMDSMAGRKIDTDGFPAHIAIIMDGNRR